MITLTKGNIFDADVDALVNPVNCVGVMGKGLALQFKKKYPENYKSYKALCDKERMPIGHIHTFGIDPIILNFPTKYDWRENSKLRYIKFGLATLLKVIDAWHIESIAIPPLGCGLGGLDWNDVKPLIIEYMELRPNVNTVIYEP